MREINREIVSAVILSRDNKIFLGKKSEKTGQVYGGCWAIPGGGIDPGEDNLTALKREIMEETMIDAADAEIKLIDDKKTGTSEKILKDTGEKVLCHMRFHDYKVSLTKNADEIETNTDREFEESGWFSIHELKKLKLTPPSEELFKMMGYLD